MLNDFKHWRPLEYAWLLVASLAIILISLVQKDTLLSTFVALCGVICVVLIAKGKLSNYYYGTINTALYGFMAFKAQFYGNGLLYLFYFTPLNIYGIFAWRKHLSHEEVEVRRLNLKQVLLVSFITIIAVSILALVLNNFQDKMPINDSVATVFGVVAMILMVMRYAEQWILWILLNVFTISLWGYNYYLHATDISILVMWSVFLINSVYGYFNWLKHVKQT